MQHLHHAVRWYRDAEEDVSPDDITTLTDEFPEIEELYGLESKRVPPVGVFRVFVAENVSAVVYGLDV